MIDADDLAAVVRRAGAGDLRALARLYDATSARAYGMCRRLLDDPQVAEDATEDAYREVWRRASTYDPARGSATAWVLAIVHRVAVAQAHQSGVARCSTAASGAVEPGPSDEVLAQLTTMEWASLVLAYFGGRRHGDVADVLGLTPAAAQARIRDGLLHVRQLMTAG